MKFLFQALLFCAFFAAIIACKNRNPVSTPPISTDWPKDSIRVVQDSFSYPWEILWGKDNHIWMTERGGRILRIEPRTGARAFSFTIPDVVSFGEGGLLGMVQHPDFSTNGFLYVVYNYRKNGVYIQKVVRYVYQTNSLINPIVLVDNIPAANIHNGSRLFIANDKLFISTGDAAIPSLAQDTASLSGKILRINLDGSIPADNPFPNNRIWSYGHRNPQGMIVANNKLYTSEHGANIEDEINIIEKGRNCGWPSVEGPCNGVELNFCSLNNVHEPILSSGSSTLAYCGMDYYNSSRIPQWANSLLLVTLKDQSLRQLKLSGDGATVISSKTYLKNAYGRLRDVCVSPEGRVYVCTSNAAGFDLLIEIQKPD
jgi:aldose sugar dehydrogenase